MWARSPLLLLRFPTLAIAIAAGSCVDITTVKPRSGRCFNRSNRPSAVPESSSAVGSSAILAGGRGSGDAGLGQAKEIIIAFEIVPPVFKTFAAEVGFLDGTEAGPGLHDEAKRLRRAVDGGNLGLRGRM